VCSASIVETYVRVSKNDQLNVLVVFSLCPVLLIFDEEVCLLYSVVEDQCSEHQLVEFLQLENVVGCKWDNMNHTCMLLVEYFLEYS
jgi:hypothetical protein